MCIRDRFKPEVVRVHAEALLAGLGHAVSDRSSTARKMMANAAALVGRLSSTGMANLVQSHLEKYGDGSQLEQAESASQLFEELTLHAQDSLNQHLPGVVSVAFVAQHSGAKAVQKSWKIVWEENTGSLEGALRAHSDEMVGFMVRCLGSDSYQVRTQAAAALTRAANASNAGILLEPCLDELLPAILKVCSGPHFEGILSCLSGLGKLLATCSAHMDEPQRQLALTTILQAVEITKHGVSHQLAALTALSVAVSSRSLGSQSGQAVMRSILALLQNWLQGTEGGAAEADSPTVTTSTVADLITQAIEAGATASLWSSSAQS
eukprot:TRINITY_DN26544_c0_g1_i2.p1 TRINITY_DN26544_c0_g1~~TRINITY_DN26544_c0_g1_i2.p1  ORF type:complete len:358 (-),score=94.02 TRINITY_DN26544_c0_g1_i2:592-1557(-)